MEQQTARKRTRADLLSDDELESTQRLEGHHLKRKKEIDQKIVEEEILTPKISRYRMPLFAFV
jgi:hypothetical protein